MTTPSEILDAAADLIEPEGAFTKGAFGRDALGRKLQAAELDRAVCFCTIGAIIKAGGFHGVTDRGLHATMRFHPEFGAVLWDVVTWSDRPGRKSESAVSALRRAADLARAAETTPETPTGAS